MKRFFIPGLIGVLLTFIFLVLAGALGGMCHCSTSLQYFFPFVSMLGVNADWGVLGFLLLGLQFPIYAISIATAIGPKWKARVLAILLAFHALAVWLSFMISR